MFKIKPLFFVLALSQATASTLRSEHRQLSEELFLTYEPQTTVTDHAAIDLDQQMIETELAMGTEEGRQNAMKVYTSGAHSKSFATLTLTTALANAVTSGVEVVGQTASGTEVRGKVLDAAETGDKILRVQYATTGVQESYVGCQVGGSAQPVTAGCFQATGQVTVGAFGALDYSYTVATDNQNARTIQGFSTEAKSKMYECEKCPYPTYKQFYDYYGAFDYANQWVLAAFNKASTTEFTNGKADFSKFQEEGQAEAIKKGAAYMSVWMYVNRELEDAVDDCENDCGTDDCNADQVHAWDEGVAFYTGSIPKKSGDGGTLLYTLAQKRCLNFGTCLTSGKEAGVAGVNSAIFKNFNAGKQALQQGQCEVAQGLVGEITALMTIPMIQGTLRYAHIRGEQNADDEKAQAEGASFAAAVLPILHACSAADAKTVYDNMATGSATPNFAAVKSAFEKNYECMKVNCGDVGGLLDADNVNFFAGAEPCSGGAAPAPGGAAAASSAFEAGVGVAVGISTAVFAALI